MLTGSELLAKVKELGDASKSELVRECGYVSSKKDGSERLNFTAFYEALLEAKGMSLGAGGSAGRGKAGRSLSYGTKVQFNGNLMVGSAYTAGLIQSPSQASLPGLSAWVEVGGIASSLCSKALPPPPIST
jgi:hypothetical protein